MSYYLTLIRMTNIKKKKNLQAINAKEGVETRKLSCTVGGNINFCSHYGEQYGSSLKS